MSRVCFTHNNPTDEDEAELCIFLSSPEIKYGLYGREIGESGTRHFQGFCIYHRVHRLVSIRRDLVGCHIEPTRGTSKQARDYCCKDGDFEEFGEFPGQQGKRSDLERFFDWSDAFTLEHSRPPRVEEVAAQSPVLCTKYPRLTATVLLRAPSVIREFGEPKPWQQTLKDALLADPDDRKILFVYDPEGGSGKSWFQRWFLQEQTSQTQLLSIGKRDDLAHAIDPSRSIFLFNVPRGGMEYLQYTILEQLKDGYVFSPKYYSQMKAMAGNCHVCVFCNEQPDMNKMTWDRYEMFNTY